MSVLKSGKGLTLTTLIITVVVLIIIAGTATYTGMNVYKDAKKEAFIQEMQMIQNAVNNEYSKIELGDLSYVNYGTDSTGGEKRLTPSNLKDCLGLNGMTQTVYINFLTKNVKSENPISLGKYSLSDLSEINNIQSNNDLKKMYIYDGLIAMYDGIDKTDSGRIEDKIIDSSVVANEIWADISGNKNDAIIAFNNGYIMWKESSIYAEKNIVPFNIRKYNEQTNNYEDVIINLEEADTFSTYFKIDPNYAKQSGITSGGDETVSNYCYLYMPTSVDSIGLRGIGNKGITALSYDRSFQRQDILQASLQKENGVYNWTFTREKVKLNNELMNKKSVYINNDFYISKTLTRTNVEDTQINSNERLIYNYSKSQYCDLYNIKIYSKALSAEEIKHNNCVDATRFEN